MGSYKATTNNVSNDKQEGQSTGEDLKKVANVAEHVPIPQVKAAAKAYKTFDKVTGGKSSEIVGRNVNQITKNIPGNPLQNSEKVEQEGTTGNVKANTVSNPLSMFGGNSFAKTLFGGGSGNIKKSIADAIPPSLKIKIVVAIGVFLLFMMMVYAVFAEDDLYNLMLTNNESVASSQTTTRKCNSKEIEDRLVYLGDSRVLGIQSSVENENIEYIVDANANYDWLNNTGVSNLENLLQDNTNAIVVLSLGINDLNNIDNYITLYKDLISKHSSNKFFIASINKIDESKVSGFTNSDIEAFNSKLKESFSENYIDSYSLDIVSDDGINYDDETYKKINDYNTSRIANSGLVMCGGGDLAFKESYSDGTAQIVVGAVLSSEPDPSGAINYWSNYLNPSDFVYPKDSASGLSLGAWPKNYSEIPTQLSNYKEYNGLIWPTTPINDTYTYVYEHNGIDIMANVGTPIYSAADGTLEYSEWGHTVNKGSDETAYSVSIKLDNPITYGGVTISTIFYTHMCGIRYRCNGCNQHVSKGELVGFVGNAAGTAAGVGWAPHLHMTLYGGSYSNGLYTTKIQNLYSITPNTVRRAGE